MKKQVVVINGSPRKGWNTDLLVTEAGAGAREAGAEVTHFDLYQLAPYLGCRSCFGCKTEKGKGTCVIGDGLSPVLEACRAADAIIMGSPIYLGETSSAFRAFFERLVFPYLTYNAEEPCCNERPIPSLLIFTSNADEEMYIPLAEGYQRTLNGLLGPSDFLTVGSTMQIPDYSATDWPWTYFDFERKKTRREEVFPEELGVAFDKAKELVEG